MGHNPAVMNRKTIAAVFLCVLSRAVFAAGPLSSLALRIFPNTAVLAVDGAAVKPGTGGILPAEIKLSAGVHSLAISAEGYQAREIAVEVPALKVLEAKLELSQSGLTRIGDMPTGTQPKSIEFTPDGRFLICALLEGRGADVFDAATLRKAATLSPPAPYAAKLGFVETAFAPRRGEVWISQMTTGMIHVFRLSDWGYARSVPTKGRWTKVICISSDEKTVYASNWLSNDVSVIDAETGKVTALIGVGGVPRGLALSRDGAFLYVCMYETGVLVKIDAAAKKTVKSIPLGGALRHIVRHPETDTFFISDMARNRVLVLDGDTDGKIAEIKVGVNPNTIALTPDGRYLFVSCRGPNNPKNYVLKGPEFGKLYCIDARTNAVAEWIWGGNQPTGLCVSPDGKTVVFTDFLDLRAEAYAFDPGRIP